ncbi:WYL domain-containing protein [Sapientia aquatica]|uniref:WYL domain-containing protein n=1 Tax=Sapientia aquatica TaxID=1549640 RepID=A0A4R5VMQ1_9BURK|nr:WYL domain-containing protein [Sapientia aquatica]
MRELGQPSSPILVSFKYKDLASDISDRRVNVFKIGMHPNGYLYYEGHCSAANAFRTFKSDRIVQTVTLIDTDK